MYWCLNSRIRVLAKTKTLLKKKNILFADFQFFYKFLHISTVFFKWPFFGFAFFPFDSVKRKEKKERERKVHEALQASCIIFQNKTYWLKGKRKPLQVAEIFQFFVFLANFSSESASMICPALPESVEE